MHPSSATDLPLADLSPEVRDPILADHAELREIIAGVQELARRVIEGDASRLVALQARAVELHERFSAHLELEERLLIPVLREAELRGDHADLLSRLEDEHAEQRLLLEYILHRLQGASLPSLVVGRELECFAQVIQEDMEAEESAMRSSAARSTKQP